MTPFQHTIVLPPILLTIHGILLLPLLLPTLVHSPLYLQYSVPLGFMGFVVVLVTKQLAVKVPLPTDPRRKRLAEALEWTVLSLVGFFEEVWRWGVVRILVNLEGGQSGYGTGPWIQDKERSSYITPGIILWKSVYLMGWLWCCIESGVYKLPPEALLGGLLTIVKFAWWSYRPHPEEAPHIAQRHQHQHQNQHLHQHPHHRQDRSSLHRQESSPQISPRTSHFSSSTGTYGNPPSVNAADSSNPFYNPFRTQTLGLSDSERNLDNTSPPSRLPSRVDIQTSIADTPRALSGSQCTFGRTGPPSSRGRCRISESPQSHITAILSRDLERLQDEDPNDLEEGGAENAYASEPESESSSIRSSSETARSASATPLLSLSLPYDPNSEHPHVAFENQSLLQYQYRRLSYQTLDDTEPIPLNCNSDVYSERGDLQEGVDDRGQGDPSRSSPKVSPSRHRPYPSYPSYSASYNHSYFSASPVTHNRLPNPNQSPPSPLSPTNGTLHRQQVQQPPSQRQHSQKPSILPLHHYLSRIYGVDTNSLNIWLPVLWRTASLCRGLGHVMLFAWFPSLFYEGNFQFWTFLVVLFVAIHKGWYTVEWVGGAAAR